jgi:hypothetical protein
VVSIAAAAPALAACSGNANLSTSTHTALTGNNATKTVPVTLRNTGGTTTGLSLTVTSSVPGALDWLRTQPQGAGGWSLSNPSTGQTSLTITTGTQLGCNNPATALKFRVKLQSNSVHPVLTFLFTSTNGAVYSFQVQA